AQIGNGIDRQLGHQYLPVRGKRDLAIRLRQQVMQEFSLARTAESLIDPLPAIAANEARIVSALHEVEERQVWGQGAHLLGLQPDPDRQAGRSAQIVPV